MTHRILAGIVLGIMVFAAAAVVARASKLGPQSQMGTIDAGGH